MSRPPVNGGLSEHTMQAAVVTWARMAASGHLALAALYAVPNGARTTPGVAAKLKAEGMKPGVPDLVLPVPANGAPGLVVEMKTLTGSVSREQKAWLGMLKAMGFKAVVCRSIEAAIDALTEHAKGWDREATEEQRAAMLNLWNTLRTLKG